MTTTTIPEPFIRYLAERDRQRLVAIEQILSALTPREQRLVKEAAVMGYVQGAMAHAGHRCEIPPNVDILARVIDGCRTFPDLYPTITNHTPENDDDA